MVKSNEITIFWKWLIFSYKITNMKLLSTATVAATLLSYVAADASKVELHKRALRAFSDRKSLAISRKLGVSEECMTKQAEVELTDINLRGERNDYCDTEIKVGFWKEECDWDDFTFDSVACANAGGKVNKIYIETECNNVNSKQINYPHCLHVSCDAEEC
jgi:hypothetical protein